MCAGRRNNRCKLFEKLRRGKQQMSPPVMPVLRQLPSWFLEHNEKAPHSGLAYREPRERERERERVSKRVTTSVHFIGDHSTIPPPIGEIYWRVPSDRPVRSASAQTVPFWVCVRMTGCFRNFRRICSLAVCPLLIRRTFPSLKNGSLRT